MNKELVKLANHLDKVGHRDLADRLDNILKSAQDTGDTGAGTSETGDTGAGTSDADTSKPEDAPKPSEISDNILYNVKSLYLAVDLIEKSHVEAIYDEALTLYMYNTMQVGAAATSLSANEILSSAGLSASDLSSSPENKEVLEAVNYIQAYAQHYTTGTPLPSPKAAPKAAPKAFTLPEGLITDADNSKWGYILSEDNTKFTAYDTTNGAKKGPYPISNIPENHPLRVRAEAAAGTTSHDETDAVAAEEPPPNLTDAQENKIERMLWRGVQADTKEKNPALHKSLVGWTLEGRKDAAIKKLKRHGYTESQAAAYVADIENQLRTDVAPVAEASDDLFGEAKRKQDRINKLAELMSGEFTVNTPGSFRR
jgi:hypothetical protein